MGSGVGVLVGRGVELGGAGWGVTVAGPITGVRVGKAVGVAKGVSVLVGVPVGTGVPARVGVRVDVRVGRGVLVRTGTLLGVSNCGADVVVASGVPSPSSMRIGASVPTAVGVVRLRGIASSGARLQAGRIVGGRQINKSAVRHVRRRCSAPRDDSCGDI